MQYKFEALRENLDEFVQQYEYPLLLIVCSPGDLAYIIKFLQGLEEVHPEHYFIAFPEPFHTSHGYLDAVVENIRIQVEAANPIRAEQGAPPFPPVPAALSEHLPPEERLVAILDYLQRLLPDEPEHYVVVGFLPLECSDVDAYAQLFSTIVPDEESSPWQDTLRIVIYDDRKNRQIATDLFSRRIDTVLTVEVDFSTPAIMDALTKSVADVSRSSSERMACFYQLASLDYAYKRYPEALEKYGVLHEYYQQQGIASMQALSLLGAGDTLRADGQPAPAKEMMQRGIALSVEHQDLGTLLNSLISITDVCSDLQQYDEAESYADSGTQVAAGVLNPFAYADLYEKKGDAQIAQDKKEEGIKTYKRCEELCEMYEYYHRWKSVLEKQIAVFKEMEMLEECEVAEQSLVRVTEKEQGKS